MTTLLFAFLFQTAAATTVETKPVPTEHVDFAGTVIYGKEWKPVGVRVTVREARPFEVVIPERTHFRHELRDSMSRIEDPKP